MASESVSFPYEALAIKKYKSPHKNDLSFGKGDRIRVTAFAPKEDDDEDDEEEDDDRWLIGETLDGTKTGTFPASHVELASSSSLPVTSAPLDASREKEESKEDDLKADNVNTISPDQQSEKPKVVAETTNDVSATSNSDVATDKAAQVEDETVTDTNAGKVEETTETKASSAQPTASTTVEPSKKPSSPPLAPKPSGLAARIAAFNKPQDAPPPIPRGKPGGGWKPPPPTSGGPKPVLPGPSAAAQMNRAPNRSAEKSAITTEESVVPDSVLESQKDKSNTGFSAADAQTSIKMSLKERMAALQRNETNSSQRETAAAKPAPKPAPGRIDEEKRAAALASMGNQTKTDVEEGVEMDTKEEDKDQNGTIDSELKEESSQIEETNPIQISSTNEDGEEKTEEEMEAERRAAIAKRMAALGGRRMGGGPGPTMFGAPAPSSKPRKLSTDSRSTADGLSDVPTKDDTTGQDDSAALNASKEDLAEKEDRSTTKSEKTLAVPRRTAPPRRKKSSTSSQPSSVSPSVDEPARQQSIEEEKEENKDVDTLSHESSHGSPAVTAGVGAGAAGIGAALLTEEPSSAHNKEEEKETIAEPLPSAPQVIEPENDETLPAPVERRQTQDSIASRKTEQSASVTDADSFEPGTPVSQSELEEHARQLEAFVRTPEAESNRNGMDEDVPDVQDREEGEEDANTSVPVIAEKENQATDRSETIVPTPRPPSARPPVPKSSLPPATDDESIQRFASPPPSRAPPVPKSSLPTSQEAETRTLSPPPQRAPPIPSASPVGRRESSLIASVEGLQDDNSKTKEDDQSSAPVLAAPRPRMAVPADESEDEEEQEEGVETEAREPSHGEDTGQTEELTEEEEERQRRSRLAERMARMGGMPIMGAPMPFRKPPKVATEPEEDTERTIEADEQPRNETEPLEHSTQEEKVADEEEVEPVTLPSAPRSAISSPPPIPTKCPPPPARSPDMAKRASQSFAAGGDLARSGSSRARPPVPVVSHSRGATNEEIAEMEAAADPIASQEPPRVASPPALPSSPPPRPPSRAPPTGRQGSIVSIGQVAQDRSAEEGLTRDSSVKLNRSGSIGEGKDASSSSLKGVQPSAPSARDIDLMPSSQWWRHGRPVKLPPTLMRPDAVRTVDVQDEGNVHLIRVDLLFEDYSSSAISVKYQDDDANEEHTELAQKHNFSPSRPSSQQMKSWSHSIGSSIARQASTFLTKGQQIQIGDGTSRGFITALIALSTEENALPPVGSSFGAIVLAQAATTSVDQGSDEIRPGDIVALHGADFKGKRGLTPYHVTYGTTQEPAFACVLEAISESSKKRKLRCILVPTSSATGKASSKIGLPEEVSLRLDDVKSGLLRVFRVAPKHGWLPE